MLSTIRRNTSFLESAAVLLTLVLSQVAGLELAYTYLATAAHVDLAFPLEWALFSLVLLRKLTLLVRDASRATGTEFVILILIHYEDWAASSDGGRFMQLNSVKEDIKLLLNLLDYQHDDTARAWYILTDFGCIYRDSSGEERLVTLRTIEEATKNGASGLIYYGGHCHYMAPGTSKKRDNLSVYTETEDFQQGGKAAYLVCGDGQRIYGDVRLIHMAHVEWYWKSFQQEFAARLHGGRNSTITVVLDTCGAAGFTADFPNLGYTYDPEPEDTLQAKATLPSHTGPLHQLVVVTASRLHEKAVSFGRPECGALTYFLTRFLQERPNDSALSIVKRIDDEFATQPKKDWRQHPQIQSRYRLN
ncbi:hypothetical protein FRC01_004106, partial [Tulasnella sp. 417]